MNLRHVPEELRPPQETPDPDDDPTREWRERQGVQVARSRERQETRVEEETRQRPLAKISAQLLGRDYFELGIGAVGGLLVGAPAAELRDVAEAGALHVLVGDLDDQFRAEGLPR